MDCPRCDSVLEHYALEGHEAVVCETCGYIGVPVDHGGDPPPAESWDEAIERFHETVATGHSSNGRTAHQRGRTDDSDLEALTPAIVPLEDSE